MIRFSLRCGEGHGFDSWFRSSAEFDSLDGRGLLSCPACGSAAVTKALMAPAVSTRKASASAEAPTPAPAPAGAQEPPQGGGGELALVDPRQEKLRGMLRELRAQMTANSEDVGDAFPEVARKMHFAEIEQKTVHGRATAEEAKALADEGVPVQPLPAFPDDMN